MSHDCDDSEMLGMDMFMLEHCDSDSLHHDSSDEHTCGTCLFHCSSAVLVAFDIITPVEPSLPEFQYLMSRTFSVYSRMLRPPQTA